VGLSSFTSFLRPAAIGSFPAATAGLLAVGSGSRSGRSERGGRRAGAGEGGPEANAGCRTSARSGTRDARVCECDRSSQRPGFNGSNRHILITTNMTGSLFLTGALLLRGGRCLLPRRVGMFFQSDDFPDRPAALAAAVLANLAAGRRRNGSEHRGGPTPDQSLTRNEP
jgi:hypothetical protein